jgi:uncharacterized membrane protein
MKRKNTPEEKDSVIAVIILLLLLFFYFKQKYWIYTALSVAVISLLVSGFAFYLHKLWSTVSEILGRVSGTIILTLIFIFILFPTALLKRLFGKKDILLNDKNLKSVFLERNHKYTATDLSNPW